MRRVSLVLLLVPFLAGCPTDAVTGPSGTCGGPQPYTVGATATGKLGENECSGPGGIVGHLFALALTGQTNFAVSMVPSGFEGVVGLWTASNQLVFEASGSGAIGAPVFLPAGQYTLVVGRSKQGAGSYTLSTRTTALTDCGTDAWTIPGASISGTLTESDCAGAPGVRQDIYFIRLAAGQTINATATMDQPGQLAVFTGTTVLANKQVAKGGSASLSYTATSSGVYSVRAMRDQTTQSQSYTISIN